MQVLIITLGSIGDVMPFLAIAERLRTRGHDCVLASSASYSQLVQAAGFPFAIIWERGSQSIDEIVRDDPAQAWKAVHDQMLIPAVEPTAAFIADFARRAPTVVLASWSAFGAFRARQQISFKLVSTWLSPYPLRFHRTQAGIADVEIALFPDWFARGTPGVYQMGFPILDDGQVPQLPEDLASFLGNGPAPIVLTPGSFMRQSRHFLEAGLKACSNLGLRTILLTPHLDQVPTLPTSARHYPYIALQRLAPRAAAIVHHGGIGTAAQGLKAGIPHVLAPIFFDQFDNSLHLERLGVGQQLRVTDTASMTHALKKILLPSVISACEVLKSNFATDSLARVCDTIESLA